MRGRNNVIEAAKTAAEHHTTICQFDAIARLALGSDIHHSAQRTGKRIAALCRAEQQRQLKRMDAALARVAPGVLASDGETFSRKTTMSGEQE